MQAIDEGRENDSKNLFKDDPQPAAHLNLTDVFNLIELESNEGSVADAGVDPTADPIATLRGMLEWPEVKSSPAAVARISRSLRKVREPAS